MTLQAFNIGSLAIVFFGKDRIFENLCLKFPTAGGLCSAKENLINT